MVGRMGGGLHFLVEIELEMAKMPAFTNLNATSFIQAVSDGGQLYAYAFLLSSIQVVIVL